MAHHTNDMGLEQVQTWLTENKSKIGKPALLSLRWRQIYEVILQKIAIPLCSYV